MSAAKQVLLTAQAEIDLGGALEDGVNRYGLVHAEKYRKKVEAALRWIAVHGHHRPAILGLSRPDVRRHNVDPYAFFYVVQPDRIILIAFLHQRTDIAPRLQAALRQFD